MRVEKWPTLQQPTSRRPVDRIITSVEARRPTILHAIRGARRRIALSLFRCNDSEIFLELARACDRGVKVHVLVTSRAGGRKSKLRKLWANLEQTGAEIHAYTDPAVKYHAKYLVVDDGPAIVATFNFTHKCFKKTCDALAMTYDPAVVEGLNEMMKADRVLRPLPAELSPRLIIGPESARRQFTMLVEQARQSIRLIDPKLSDPDLLTLLSARRAAGLRVEILGSRWLGGLKSHGKILLIDDRIAAVGSIAFTPISLDFRREAAITVEQGSAVGEVVRLFRTLAALPPGHRVVAPVQRNCRLDPPQGLTHSA
jgi:phosphatidylserine/phosphatidylglycerophosphate/cardiolipin synthase-like enzyme